jgi:hypothetical protein
MSTIRPGSVDLRPRATRRRFTSMPIPHIDTEEAPLVANEAFNAIERRKKPSPDPAGCMVRVYLVIWTLLEGRDKGRDVRWGERALRGQSFRGGGIFVLVHVRVEVWVYER